MVIKRVQFSRREKMHQCCGSVCPSVALLCGLLMIQSANSSLNQPAFELDIGHFNSNSGDANQVPFAVPDAVSSEAAELQQYLTKVGAPGGVGPARFVDYTAEVRARVDEDRDKEIRWPTSEHSSALYLNGMGKGVAENDVPLSKQCLEKYLKQTYGSSSFVSSYRMSERDELKCASIEHLAFDSVCQPVPSDSHYAYRQQVWELTDPNTGLMADKAGLRSNMMGMFPSPYTSAGSLSGDIGTCPAQIPGTVHAPLQGDGPFRYPSWRLALAQKLHAEGGGENGYTRKDSIHGGLMLDPTDPSLLHILHNTSARHGVATYLNLFGDMMYRSLADKHFASNPSEEAPLRVSITVTNHPLPVTAKFREQVGRGLFVIQSINSSVSRWGVVCSQYSLLIVP
jgi:hypothetical protein